LSEAPILAVIFLLVLLVVILKVAELAPAGMVTLDGTEAFAGLLLASATTTGIDVALFKVTVPTELAPPTTVFGFNASVESAAGDAAVTVKDADLLTAA
jgi:hypothetical protein